MIGEVGLGKNELNECFNLVCNVDQNLAYRRWILSMFPDFKPYFSINVTPRESVRIDESLDHQMHSQHHLETSMNERSSQKSIQIIDNVSVRQRYASAKQKIEQYMV